MRTGTLTVAAALIAASAAVAADDPALKWRYRATRGGVTLAANPLTSAARVAFYEARGFSTGTIRPYARTCGFSLGMQNGGRSAVTTRLADWRAIGSDGREVALRLPETWDAEWARSDVAPAGRIAFRWAQFQSENVFERGDWIMGMATLESPLPGNFRLVARYRDGKGDHEIALDKLACARD